MTEAVEELDYGLQGLAVFEVSVERRNRAVARVIAKRRRQHHLLPPFVVGGRGGRGRRVRRVRRVRRGVRVKVRVESMW